MTNSVLWFRRDLRLHDHPALAAAAADGPVLALFVLDEALRRPSGAARLTFLYRTLRALDADLREHGGGLVVRRGRPERVVPAVVREVNASAVHVSTDYGPYGRVRDERVEQALGDVPLVRTGSPYAVAPGRIRNGSGDPYKVFSAFYRAWRDHGWRAPARSSPARTEWLPGEGVSIHEPRSPAGVTLPDAGEAAAQAAWRRFRRRLDRYADERDRPDLDTTSRLSPYLKFGSIHPRTLLAALGAGASDETFRRELAWREFYAAVLYSWPDSARQYFDPRLAELPYATGRIGAERLAAWKAGRTGYPIVDAGMQQLLAEGWMHNRVRMIVASFLVKDLHVEWMHGARHFMRHLVDGDLASNQHNWQWVAGTGTDAAPYFRIFNPITQARTFDPDGRYIRRWVPELADTIDVHDPSDRPDGYPEPIVEHARERRESLAACQTVRARPERS